MIQSPQKSFFFFFAKVMKGQKKRSKRLVFRRKSSRKSASHLSRFDLLLGAISLFFIQYTKILRCSQNEPIIIVCKCRERKKKLSKGSDYSAVAEQHYPPHLLNCNRKILERQNSLLTLFHHQPQPASPASYYQKRKKRNFYILQAH